MHPRYLPRIYNDNDLSFHDCSTQFEILQVTSMDDNTVAGKYTTGQRKRKRTKQSSDIQPRKRMSKNEHNQRRTRPKRREAGLALKDTQQQHTYWSPVPPPKERPTKRNQLSVRKLTVVRQSNSKKGAKLAPVADEHSDYDAPSGDKMTAQSDVEADRAPDQGLDGVEEAPEESESDSEEAPAPSEDEETEEESSAPSDDEAAEEEAPAPSDDEEAEEEAPASIDDEETEEGATTPSDDEKEAGEDVAAPSDDEEVQEESSAPSEYEKAEEETPAPSEDEEAEEEASAPSEGEEAEEEAPAPSDDEAAEEEAPAPSDDEEAEEETPAPSDDEEAEEGASAPSDDEEEAREDVAAPSDDEEAGEDVVAPSDESDEEAGEDVVAPSDGEDHHDESSDGEEPSAAASDTEDDSEEAPDQSEAGEAPAQRETKEAPEQGEAEGHADEYDDCVDDLPEPDVDDVPEQDVDDSSEADEAPEGDHCNEGENEGENDGDDDNKDDQKIETSLVAANTIPHSNSKENRVSQNSVIDGLVKEFGSVYRIFEFVKMEDNNKFCLTELIPGLFVYEEDDLTKGKCFKTFKSWFKRNYQRQLKKLEKTGKRVRQEGSPLYITFHEFVHAAVMASRGEGRISRFSTLCMALMISPTETLQRALMAYTAEFTKNTYDVNAAAAILGLTESQKMIYQREVKKAPPPPCTHVTTKNRLCKMPRAPNSDFCKRHFEQ
jgi:hypothetical protein